MKQLFQIKKIIATISLPLLMLLMLTYSTNSAKAACNKGQIYLYEYHDTGTFVFYAYFANGNNARKSFTWNFGDGNTGTGYNPTHQYASSGTYNACAYIYDSTLNCTDTVCKKVCYFKAPKVSFTRTGQTITTTITCTGSLKYLWDFGDGNYAYGCNFTHTYATKDMFNLRITRVTDTATGCIDSFYNKGTDTVIDFTRCGFKSNFEFYTTTTIDTRYVYAVNHYDYNKPKKGTEYWIWGDGSTTTVIKPISYYTYITHKYARSGTFTTCHILVDSATGCSDTTCKQVKIDSCTTNANFTYTIAGRKVTFTNTSTNANSFYWTFGNGYTSYTKNPTHTYSADGTFTVCMTASYNGCSKQICKTITIETCKLSPDFSYTIDTATGKVLFFNTSLKGLVSSWSFGDGNYDNTGVHRTAHTYNKNNDYQACMTVVSCDANCSQTVCKQIKFKAPIPDTACKNKNAYFTSAYSKLQGKYILYNQSNFGHRFFWKVYSKTGNNTVYQYNKDSAYYSTSDSLIYVCLVAYDTTYGCMDTFCNTLMKDSLPQLAVRHLNDKAEWLNVYPNPAGQKVTIAYEGNKSEVKVDITDINGKLIRTVYVGSGQPLEMSTSGMAAGVYMIRPDNASPPFKLVLQQ